jgi:Cytochrome c554 and c-prime
MRPESRPPVRRLLAGLAAVVAFAVAWITLFRPDTDPPQLAAAPEAGKVEPQILFDGWKKPDLVIVLSGQMHGYLQKCGCSNPQKGGLERRYNFIESLKARGWEVIALDIGDVPHPLPYTPTPEQTLAKYEMAMQAMKLMDYKATAVGKEELSMPLLNALTKYTVQKGNEYPKVHAANIENAKDFPNATGGSALTESDVITTKGGLKVGVIGVAGLEVTSRPIDRTVKFDANPAAVVANTLKAWAAKPTDVNVLLYQGPMKWTDPDANKKVDATTAAEAFPGFQIVLCKTPNDAEAPDMPTVVNGGKTMICQVGQKGQTVGVVGIYKGPKGTEYLYQRVVMTEEFETPPEKEKGHPILKLLQDYSDSVKDNDYLSEMDKRKKLHSVQALPKHEKAAYAGDTQCFVCHQAEFQVWQKSKHAGAYNALAVIAKHPTGRNFDGECIICHTVGYDFKTGYVNNKLTPNLQNVQCESCHGPASLHVTEETDNLKKKKGQTTHAFVMSLSPWKVKGEGAMPSLKKLEAMVKETDPTKREALLTPAENHTYLAVYQVCYKCHDLDNDPKFKLESYWPNVVHTGLKKK